MKLLFTRTRKCDSQDLISVDTRRRYACYSQEAYQNRCDVNLPTMPLLRNPMCTNWTWAQKVVIAHALRHRQDDVNGSRTNTRMIRYRRRQMWSVQEHERYYKTVRVMFGVAWTKNNVSHWCTGTWLSGTRLGWGSSVGKGSLKKILHPTHKGTHLF